MPQGSLAIGKNQSAKHKMGHFMLSDEKLNEIIYRLNVLMKHHEWTKQTSDFIRTFESRDMKWHSYKL